MRCLYCGNELPVFKKLTGGGEFCSEAHRQSYQEEYNRLALSRLLQAQTPDDRSKIAKRGTTETLSPVATEAEAPVAPAKRANGNGSAKANQPTNGKHSTPSVLEAQAAAAPAEPVIEEAQPPAGPADFLWEVPDPIWWESADFRSTDAVFCDVPQTVLQPAGVALLQLDAIEQDNGDLAMAEPFSLAALRQASKPQDYRTRPRENRLEVREFGRVEPRVTVELGTAETAKLTSAVAARDYEIAPIPPGEIGQWRPWTAGERPFPEGSAEIEFAEPLRLDFHTTGLEVPSEDGGETQVIQVPAPAVLSKLSEANKASGVDQESDLRAFLPKPVENPAVAEPLKENAVELILQDKDADAKAAVEVAEEALVESPVETQAPAETVEPEIEPVIAAKEAVVVSESIVEVEPEPVIEASREVTSVEQPPVVSEPDPKRATTPLPIEPQALAPAPAAIKPPMNWVPVTSFRMHIPRVTALPLRPMMTFGPSPAAQGAKPEPVAEVKEAPAKVEAPETPKAQPTAAQNAVDRRSRDSRNASRNLKIRNRGVPAPPPTAPEPPAAAAQPVAASTPAPVAAAPAAPAPAAVVEAPAVKEAKETPKPAPVKAAPPAPKVESKTAFEKASAELAQGNSFGEALHLNVQPVGFIEGLPGVVKIGGVVAVLAIIAFVAYLSLSSGSGKSGGKDPVVETAGPGMLIGEGGWSTDWTGEAAGVKRLRQISIYRPSLNLSDYRVELQGQIEAKSMGIVYRANNPQNYYVVKLEILKPGLNPQVALVRWAVTNGEDGPKAQIPLPMPVRIDTLYKLRLDVRGNTFATYVLDQKVDQWSDDRIRSGGVGLINERGDRSTIKAVMVTPLVAKAK